MPDILHDLTIRAPLARVFEAISSPNGLDQWWTKRAKGVAKAGASYELWFGPEYDWRATVSECTPPNHFELEMTSSDDDWNGTRVGFHLEQFSGGTKVRFSHRNWPSENEHFRVSAFCWASYLRILKRYLEKGEKVPYEQRDEAG